MVQPLEQMVKTVEMVDSQEQTILQTVVTVVTEQLQLKHPMEPFLDRVDTAVTAAAVAVLAVTLPDRVAVKSSMVELDILDPEVKGETVLPVFCLSITKE